MDMITYPREVEDALILAQNRFVWEAPSFERSERGPRWFVGLLAVSLLLLAYAVWTANFLFAFIILLIGIVLLLAGNHEPKTTLVQVGDHGIVWGGKLIPFQNVDSFALVYQPPTVKTLYIEPKNPLVPRLRIPLEEQDPVALREHLRSYATEDLDLQGEHVSDILARLLKL